MFSGSGNAGAVWTVGRKNCVFVWAGPKRIYQIHIGIATSLSLGAHSFIHSLIHRCVLLQLLKEIPPEGEKFSAMVEVSG